MAANEEIAKTVYERARDFDAVFASLLDVVETVEDEGLRQQFIQAAKDVIGLVYREILHPLQQRYPDIIPDQEK